MTNSERPSDYRRSRNEPLQPSPLPPELVDFLKDRPFAALLHPSDQGTVLVVKAPLAEIRKVVGRVPILLQHELHENPHAPVIRTRVRIYDDPQRPLAFECFTNIADEQQRADFAALGQQKDVFFLFYDEQMHHRLSKRVATTATPVIPLIVRKAEKLRAAIPADQFDFDTAKNDVMQQNPL